MTLDVRQSIVDGGKLAAGQISAALGSLFPRSAAGSSGILMYHRIASEEDLATKPTWSITPERFRSQIGGLVDRGFTFWSLRRLIELSREKRFIPDRVAAITFDDGYEGVYRWAFPILKEFNVPATVFVCTAYIDLNGPMPFDPWAVENQAIVSADSWRTLTWQQCREMESSGIIEIGSHTHSHRDFRGKPHEFVADLRQSLQSLTERFGDRKYLFSFPFGGRSLGFASDSMLDVVANEGVLCALTTETKLAVHGTSPFGWGRLEAHGSDTGAILAAKLTGWYNWMGTAREWFRRFSPPSIPTSKST